jgi:CRISPR system Cascade subunit CasA
LPGVLANLTADEFVSFAALRPHQRHAWHSFLVLLAANALHRAGLATPPETEDAWRHLLRALTPDHPDDSPWCLIAPPDRPALLQPPIPDGLQNLKNRLATPDELDMLVTSKNHDIKQSVMAGAAPEDWFFALLTLQTMEGFLGAGNYGISRMNGGFANRAACSIAPPGGAAAQFRRDLARLLARRDQAVAPYAKQGGLALVWLAPWDGTQSIDPAVLDPRYIEICRRVRLVSQSGVITAQAGNSKVPRIIPIPGGVTGDPWSPAVLEKAGTQKSLTVDARGFGYARLVELMLARVEEQAPLQIPDAADAGQGLQLLARALVRGQGKTEGYHERRIPISRKALVGFGARAADRLADIARGRVTNVADLERKVLKPALLVLFQNAPEKLKFDDKESNAKAEVFLKKLDAHVDSTFFPDLWAEYDEDDTQAQLAIRVAWIAELKIFAQDLLRAAQATGARATRRRFRAEVYASDVFTGAYNRNFPKAETSA